MSEKTRQRLDSQGKQIEHLTVMVQELQAVISKILDVQNLEWIRDLRDLVDKDKLAELKKSPRK